MKLLDVLQAASNASAQQVSGNVDLIAAALRAMGVPVGEAPVGSTEWLRQKGLYRDVSDTGSRLVGETVGMTAPIVAAAKAPQIARGLLQMGENATAPGALNAGMRKQRGAFKFPQEDALAQAQRNAAKPVSEGGLGLRPDNTPMERAAAMGFVDEGLLHGTVNDFPAFAQSSRHSVYATDVPEIADIYANATGRHRGLREVNAGPNVIPLMSRGKRIEVSDFRDGSGGWVRENLEDALKTTDLPKFGFWKGLPKHGYQSAKVDMEDLGGRQAQYIFPDPSVLRSRFAAFDPAKRDSADLLASLAALGIGVPLFMGSEE